MFEEKVCNLKQLRFVYYFSYLFVAIYKLQLNVSVNCYGSDNKLVIQIIVPLEQVPLLFFCSLLCCVTCVFILALRISCPGFVQRPCSFRLDDVGCGICGFTAGQFLEATHATPCPADGSHHQYKW